MGNRLGEVELAKKPEREERRKRRKQFPQGYQTRIARDRRSRQRLPPPVPKNKSLAEIEAMDDEDPAFRFQKQGRPRKWHGNEAVGGVDGEPQDWRDVIRKGFQKREQARRAKVRKWEAKVMAAARVMDTHSSRSLHERDIYDEEKAIAEGILNLDDWDLEELVRGYRRNRQGNFGRAPKYIPREIQQAAFRALVNRGERRMKEAYYEAIERLVDLAHNADSEKVKLDAIRELMNRVVGKVPDKVLVSTDEPWEHVLAESLVPMGDMPVIDLTPDAGGTYALPAADWADESEGEVEDSPSPRAARGLSAQSEQAPSPSRPTVPEVLELRPKAVAKPRRQVPAGGSGMPKRRRAKDEQ